MSFHPLEEIIHPRAIAVVGASPAGRGSGFLSPLLKLGYQGDIYPVNPKYTEIMGLKTYPRVRDIPGPLDYVISSVPASQVLGMLEDCSEKGVKAVHLFTARFSETGRKEAAELEQEILKKAREAGIRLIGPNCLGLYHPSEGISFNEDMPAKSGDAGLVSQSGGATHETVALAVQRGVFFSKAISYGNALDFNECDYLEYFEQDPETRVIMMYIEGVRDGQRFFNILHRVTATKPVIIVKGGRGQSGIRATASHTGSLAGSMQVWQNMVRQTGAISAANLEELVDIAAAFYFLPPITERRVGIVGGGGGSSVLAADECEEAGLDVVPLPMEIREKMKATGSPIWDWISNPADMSIRIDREWDVGDMLELMAQSKSFDLLITFIRGHFHSVEEMASVDNFLKPYRLGKLEDKPLIAVMEEARYSVGSNGRGNHVSTIEFMEKVKSTLLAAGTPFYPNVGRAARALSKMIDYYQRKKSR